MPHFMVSYDDAVSLGPEVVGGKGWNLGRLQQYGFSAPTGGILNAEIYQQFMNEPELHAITSELATMQIGTSLETEVEDILRILRTTIEATTFPPEIEQAVDRFLIDARMTQRLLAVRSSATTEDSTIFSFAGIHESFLNVPCTLQEVLQAIKGCYASLWTPRALAYRRHYGLADDTVACAVVICVMITGPEHSQPDAAGVAFSCDPRTGQRDRVTINAASGWGTHVVTGDISPEAITVILSTDDEPLRIERAKDQLKVLSDKQAYALASLVQRILWALGDGQEHQDIEWVYDGDDFWIVQSRPVTHLPRLTFTEIANLPTIWSNGNLKDVMPGILTPLSWSVLRPMVTTFLQAPCLAAGYTLPEGLEIMRRIKGYAYLNLTSLQWSYYDALGVLPREFNEGIGGHQPEITVSQSPLRGRKGLHRLRGRLRLLRAIGRNARTLPEEMARIREHVTLQNQVELTELTNAEILARIKRLRQQGNAFGLRFQFANMGGVWGDYLIQTLERERPEQGRSLASALMAGTRSVISAEHAYQLYEIAIVARDDTAAITYLTMDPRDPQGWRHLPQNSAFRQAFTSFLDAFGHRSIYEFELANLRWSEDPSYLLDCIQMLLTQEVLPTPPYAQALEKRQAAEVEVSHLPLRTRLLVAWFARQARRTASHREAGKSTLVAMLQPIREAAREVGKRMLAAHILEDREDIFFLAIPEITAFLSGEWNGQGAQSLVADRKKQGHAWLNEIPDGVLFYNAEGKSVVPSATEGLEATLSTSDAERRTNPKSKTLQGLAASPGQAHGRARVILHPHDGQSLQAGEILIAPSTDPAWTPLFLRASAIVMETGGYLSHGAIVAREFGIPAVVNIPDLLKRIEDGQDLTVDGNLGRIILE